MGYSFELLTDDFSAQHIRDTVQALEGQMKRGWPCWAISNHDVQRVATRWGGNDAPPHIASMLTALACSLRGSVCVFQGEELGLTEAELPYDLLQDPYGITFWPTFKGRDGCRTPMPWTDAPHGGFTRVSPWLPVPDAHRLRSVLQQERESDSPLQRFRRFLRWRKQHAALVWGEVQMLAGEESVLGFERHLDGVTIRAYFNTAANATEFDARLPATASILNGHGLVSGELASGRVHLPAYAALFLHIA